MAVDSHFHEILNRLLGSRDLTVDQITTAMDAMATGSWGEAEAASFLVALRMKGEKADEIAVAAAVVRERMVRLPTARPDVLDTCGTGGECAGTFNVSTATALVVAGAGVPVVKHGNRGVSSRSGSADVLSALGVTIDCSVETAARCLEAVGLAFCFAPHFHPAWHRLSVLRRRLGIRTLFNAVGPLANPAGAAYQLIGVGHPGLLDPVAEAAARLGTAQTFVVWGEDGLDEVSLGAPTEVRQVCGNKVIPIKWMPGDFGLEPASVSELHVSGPEESAERIRELLAGRAGPAKRVVIANAAAALMTAKRVPSLRAGVDLATQVLDTGCSRKILDDLVRWSGSSPHHGS